jgi:GT2 family glycosyltransferase
MELLAQSLDSFHANTEYPHHLVVMSNGPNQQHKYLLRRYCSGRQNLSYRLYDKNVGIARARNDGAACTDSPYIAFVDNDILYEKGWLGKCVDMLQAYPDRKLIAAPMKTTCQKQKYKVSVLDGGYETYQLASGCCLVMRRSGFEEIGPWADVPRVGGRYCERARNLGYLYIVDPKGRTRHVGKVKSWHFRDTLVDGRWQQDARRQGAYWDYLWTKKYGQNIRKHQALYDAIKPHIRGAVCDLGCGVTSLHDGNGSPVTGVDLSAVAIETMRGRVPAGRWVQADIADTQLPTAGYDTVLLISVVEHFPTFDHVLKEALRLKAEGGRIILVVPREHYDKDHRHPVWTQEDIANNIESVIGRCDTELVNSRWWLIKTKESKNGL